jgi:hypothetical protein
VRMIHGIFEAFHKIHRLFPLLLLFL